MKLLIVFCLQAFFLFTEYHPAISIITETDNAVLQEYNQPNSIDNISTGIFMPPGNIHECPDILPGLNPESTKTISTGINIEKAFTFFHFDLPPPEAV